MKNKQTVSFMTCFDSFAEVQEYAALVKDPTIILHMYYGDKELFAVCGQESLTAISEAFSDEVLKEKNT
jgi:hypothetical protein